MVSSKLSISLISILILILAATNILAMENKGYKQPEQKIIDIVDAPNLPQISVSPTGGKALLVEYTTQLNLEDLAEPKAKIAGLDILKRFNIKKRNFFVKNIKLMNLETKETTNIELPENSKFGFPTWAPDGKSFVAALYKAGGSSVWVFDAEKGTGKQISPARLNSVMVGPFWWSKDSKYVYVPLYKARRGKEPPAPAIPETPEIRETSGKISQVITYQNLIKSAYDETLFEYYASSQVYKINAKSGRKTAFGSEGLISKITTSPNGKYTIAKIIEKPYSHSVPAAHFAARYELWNEKGKLIKVLANVPSWEEVPIDGVPTGKRNMFWLQNQPATLCWVEALDGGDPNKKVDFRDVVYSLEAPFDGKAKEVIKLPSRYSGTDFVDIPHIGLVWDYDRDTKWIQARKVDFSKTNIASECLVLFGRNYNDTYKDQGDIIYKRNKDGVETALTENNEWIFSYGIGATPNGYRPFLKKTSLLTANSEDIFVSEPDKFETYIDFTNTERSKIVTRSEDPATPPNYFIRNIVNGKASKEATKLTNYKSPAEILSSVKKEVIKYKRADGVPLSGTLYYPIDYKPGNKYPTVIWAYPREYTSVEIAGQVRNTSNRYTRISGASIIFFVMHGYAVLYNAELPVVGSPLTANDTFVKQITAGAEAAVNKLIEMGISEKGKIGIAGHSYGGFMTANLLAHTDLFAAGIARSGAYNRTLTPFGFQGERRTYWQATDIYNMMSPFTYANKINEPILFIHGQEDANSGTYPIQSERLFAAIKGHGGTAKLVLLPYEGHSYEARESILHVLQEQFDWFDKYLK